MESSDNTKGVMMFAKIVIDEVKFHQEPILTKHYINSTMQECVETKIFVRIDKKWFHLTLWRNPDETKFKLGHAYMMFGKKQLSLANYMTDEYRDELLKQVVGHKHVRLKLLFAVEN